MIRSKVADKLNYIYEEQELQLKVNGELFQVRYDMCIPNDLLDFGVIQVGDAKELGFTLQNTGSYDIMVKMLNLGSKRKVKKFNEVKSYCIDRYQYLPSFKAP